MCLSGSVRLSWVGRVRPEMLCLRTRLPLFPKASRGLLYDGRPPVGGLLHKAPAEESFIPANRRCSAPHNIGISTLSGRT
ncbi:unnamed protein product [Lathyrus oleraceus]